VLTHLFCGVAWAAEVPCGEKDVVLREEGQGPNESVRRLVSEQLAVEVSGTGRVLCLGSGGDSVITLEWTGPESLVLRIETKRVSRSRSIVVSTQSLPLAIAVIAGELLREALKESEARQEEDVPPTPNVPPAEEPQRAKAFSGELAVWAESALSQSGTPLVGGSLAAGIRTQTWWGEAGAGLWASFEQATPSGFIRLLAPLVRVGAGLRLWEGRLVELNTGVWWLGTLMQTTGRATATSALGRQTWTPAMALRAGVGIHLGPLEGIRFQLRAGVGGWLVGVSIFDGERRAGGVIGFEGWLTAGVVKAW
jgi:hypothetical protein